MVVKLGLAASQTSTTVRISNEPEFSFYGQPLTFTAITSPAVGVGQVQFVDVLDGTALTLATENLRLSFVGGVPVTSASMTIATLDAREHHVRAIFLGNPSFSGSTSPEISVFVAGTDIRVDSVSFSPSQPVAFRPLEVTIVMAIDETVVEGLDTSGWLQPSGTLSLGVGSSTNVVSVPLSQGVATYMLPAPGRAAVSPFTFFVRGLMLPPGGIQNYFGGTQTSRSSFVAGTESFRSVDISCARLNCCVLCLIQTPRS